jgi:tetratricopeptide (TPR) repeat protein
MPATKGDSSELVDEVRPLDRWELDNLYIRGRDYFNKGKWKEAVGCFLEILRWEPDYEDVYDKLKEARRREKVRDCFAQGIAHCTEEAWHEAEGMFSKVLELEPAHKLAAVNQAYAQGMVYLGEKHWEEAFEQFKRVLELDATHKDAIDKVKETSLILVSDLPEERLDDAIKLLEQVRFFVKDDASVNTKFKEIKKKKRLKTLYEEGMDYLGARKWQKAFEKFTLVRSIDSNYRNVTALLKETEARLESPPAKSPNFSEWWDRQSIEAKIGLIGLVIAIVFGILGCPLLYRIIDGKDSHASATPISASTPTPVLPESQTPTIKPPTSSVPAITVTPTGTGTSSPIGTSTATPTATPTPTPMPNAPVTVEALNLRAGPGIEYKIIRTLKRGETLTVLGKTPNGYWLHVRTSRQEEGWVNASYVDLSGNLDLVPTVFAPTPLLPLTEDGVNFVNEVKLEWKWIRPLEESECFSVRVSRQDTGEVCCHDKTQNTFYVGSLVGCYPGRLFWEVAAVRLLSRDPEEWLELSPSSEPQLFNFDLEE